VCGCVDMCIELCGAMDMSLYSNPRTHFSPDNIPFYSKSNGNNNKTLNSLLLIITKYTKMHLRFSRIYLLHI